MVFFTTGGAEADENAIRMARVHTGRHKALCDEHGIVMTSDEVMAGFGRCGEWFAVAPSGVAPDLICFVRGVDSGYVPLGGIASSAAIADTLRTRPFTRGPTSPEGSAACGPSSTSTPRTSCPRAPRATTTCVRV